MTHDIVTIIGSSYFEAISVLLENLERHEELSPSDFKSGHYENGFAASICVLSVISLESYVMRVRYINDEEGDKLNKHSVSKYLTHLYPDFPYIDEIKEIFALRDLLAHNHLWKVELELEEGVGLKKKSAIRKSSGDHKYLNVIDISEEKTKKLGLNVNPIKVGGYDARKTLKCMWMILLFLEKKNRNQCYVSHLHVTHKGEDMKMGELVGLPETCT